jgi:hypothetical protein
MGDSNRMLLTDLMRGGPSAGVNVIASAGSGVHMGATAGNVRASGGLCLLGVVLVLLKMKQGAHGGLPVRTLRFPRALKVPKEVGAENFGAPPEELLVRVYPQVFLPLGKGHCVRVLAQPIAVVVTIVVTVVVTVVVTIVVAGFGCCWV